MKKFVLESMVVFLFFINFIISSCSEQTKYFSAPSCLFRKITNCSCQVHSVDNHCQVFEACEQYDFSIWFNKHSNHLNSKRSCNFEIDAVPYSLCKHRMQHYPFPAIKVTFSTTLTGIQGFVFHLFDDLATSNPYNVCRILDFRSFLYQHEHVSLSYDCLRASLSSSNNFQLHVRALSINEELKYKLLLPSINNIDPLTVCAWTPLIMVRLESLKKNTAEIKFSQAPEYLNVKKYDVYLSIKNGEKLELVRTVSVEAKLGNKPIAIVFESVGVGYYYISVKPITTNNTDCNNQHQLRIFVEGKFSEDKIIFYICSVIASGIFISICVFVLFKHVYKPRSISFPNSVLLIYSYDFKEHEVAVESLCLFLKQFCSDVTTIYSRNKDPDEWLDVNYQNAAVIIFILSYGTFHKLQNNNIPPMTEKHSWGDRFSPAAGLIYSEIRSPHTQRKKIVRICFEYSEISKIPQPMQFSMWGKIFVLPKEMFEFLNYLRNGVSTSNCLNTSKLSLRQIIRSNPEMNALLRSVNQAKVALRKTSESSIFFKGDSETVSLFYKKASDTPPPAYINSSDEEIDCIADRESLRSLSFESRPSFWDTFLSYYIFPERDENNIAESSSSFWDSFCPLPDKNKTPSVINSSVQETLDVVSTDQIQVSNQQGGFWSNFEKTQGEI